MRLFLFLLIINAQCNLIRQKKNRINTISLVYVRISLELQKCRCFVSNEDYQTSETPILQGLYPHLVMASPGIVSPPTMTSIKCFIPSHSGTPGRCITTHSRSQDRRPQNKDYVSVCFPFFFFFLRRSSTTSLLKILIN